MAGTTLLDAVAAPHDPAATGASDAAQRLARETLLRCWLRECGQPPLVDGEFQIDLPGSGVRLRVPVEPSPTGWHTFGPPRLLPLPPPARSHGDPVAVVAAHPRADRSAVQSHDDSAAGIPVATAPLATDPHAGDSAARVPVDTTLPAANPRADRSAAAWRDDRSAGVPVDAALLAALLGRQAAGRHGAAGTADGAVDDLVARVVDSTHRVAAHIVIARENPDSGPVTTPFLENEQDLILGHPFHPAPKSRVGLTDAEARAFSPELRGSFPLHWFAADRTVVSSDSAWQTGAAELIAGLCAGQGAAPRDTPPDAILVPAHPWQARELSYRPEIRELIDSGLLHDLGQSGPAWYPTSSVRTLYRPGCPIMLKLPLALSITNARRENLRDELRRGVEMHRMLAGGLGAAVAAAHPRFRILTDPAWLAVDAGGADLPGLDVMIRQSPFRPCDEISSLSALTDLGFGETAPGMPPHRLAATIHTLADRRAETAAETAVAWFERYLRELVLPVLWLDAEHGIALEAHQQNTLLALDADGMPRAAWYRDNQGFSFRAQRVASLATYVAEPGVASRTIVPDAVATERLCYYLGVNNLLGVIGALGYARLVDERVLLRLTRTVLGEFAAAHPHDVTALLLDAPTLRCKANLLTRADGLDELREPSGAGAVYVDIPNPIAAAYQ